MEGKLLDLSCLTLLNFIWTIRWWLWWCGGRLLYKQLYMKETNRNRHQNKRQKTENIATRMLNPTRLRPRMSMQLLPYIKFIQGSLLYCLLVQSSIFSLYKSWQRSYIGEERYKQRKYGDMESLVFVDFDHAYNRPRRRAITGEFLQFNLSNCWNHREPGRFYKV